MMTRYLLAALLALSLTVALAAQAVTVSHTLTANQRQAVTTIITTVNQSLAASNAECVPQPSCRQTLWTVQSYAEAQVVSLFKSYADQDDDAEAASVRDRFKRATPAQRTAAKAALPPEP